MISTRVMDLKLREAAEGMGEDSPGKKKSKFKTFKKFFGKKKRKESPSSAGSSTWTQSQAKSEAAPLESGPVGYESEDELEESRGALGNRALSHDSIFFPESGQDPARPVRVFSQENVCDRIKALQLKIQCNVKMGPPPPGGLPVKRGDDAGMSSEDDGLPSSPPEMSLLHDVGPSTTIKVSLVPSSGPLSPDHVSDTSVSPQISDSSIAPLADFNYPPEFSSCLDNSAAKHKLLVKPRNQRSTTMRRLSSRAQSECLSELTSTPEDEDEIPLFKASTEGNPGAGQQDLGLDRGPELGQPTPMLLPGGPRLRRARLQHCPALSASVEEESLPGGEPPSHMATPEVTQPDPGPALFLESQPPPEGSAAPQPDASVVESQREELPIAGGCPPAVDTADGEVCAAGDREGPVSVCIPEEDMAPPQTVTLTTLETPSSPEGPEPGVQKDVAEALAVPSPEGAGKESLAAPTPSPHVPKSCLKHKALSVSVSCSVPPAPPAPPASESPPREAPSPCALDKEAAPSELSKAGQAEATQAGPGRAAPEQKPDRGASELTGAKKFSVSSGRARPRTSSARLPLLQSGLAWRSEAALDDLQLLPEPRPARLDPPKPLATEECDSQDSGDRVAPQAVLGRSPQGEATAPAPAAQEPAPREDRAAFPVKLRSTSLSFKYREGASGELKALKRYSAEIRLERGGLTLLAPDEKCPAGPAPGGARGPRSLNEQGKGKARSSEQLSFKPPLPRKPLLPALTLPPQPEPSVTITAQEAKRESKLLEKPRAAEKAPSPAGAGADGQPMPPWITVTRQKRRGVPDLPPNQEERSGVRNLKSEIEKQTKAPGRVQVQESTKQADFVRSRSFLLAPAKPSVERKHGTQLRLKEGLQRGISLSHQNLAAQSPGMTEKELTQLKRASYADQPSWMELAKKKSQAWSDMPQIIK
ncbi:CRACD-like protein [Tenrec ecaudatus]|uniref:CRACD-like protein n=1 Tax=Tenrec ecaudatus TaxID=94439 RepID=UPI003F59ED1F